MAMGATGGGRRPFFRRKKSCPFSGRAIAATVFDRPRQNRTEPYFRSLSQEAARARPGDQARTPSWPAALPDPLAHRVLTHGYYPA